MNGPRIELDGLDVRAGQHPVLRGLDLDLPAGTTTAVLGESGAGKTTLLRAIAGLVPVDRGVIRFGDRDVTVLPPERRDVGLVFQDHLLFPHRTVAGNVGFGPRLAGQSRTEVAAVVTSWLRRVGLEGFEGRDVATLSGGQRQRVALARALATSPRVVLLDEPLGALDVALRDDLATMVRALIADTGATAVLVTHDPAEATGLSDRIAILDEGGIVQAGPARAVWERPATVTAARLLGHPNILAPDQLGLDRIAEFVVVPEDAVHLTTVGAPGASVPARVIGASLRGPLQRVVLALPDRSQLVALVGRDEVVHANDLVGVRLSPGAGIPLSREAPQHQE